MEEKNYKLDGRDLIIETPVIKTERYNVDTLLYEKRIIEDRLKEIDLLLEKIAEFESVKKAEDVII